MTWEEREDEKKECVEKKKEKREKEVETREREGTRREKMMVMEKEEVEKGKDGDLYRQTKRKREELEAEMVYSFILIGKEDQPVNPDIITLYSSSLSFFRFLEHTHTFEGVWRRRRE